MRTMLRPTNVTRCTAVAVLAALVVFIAPVAAHASTESQIASTRRAIDAAAQRWFAAQQQLRATNARIHAIEDQIARTSGQVDQARAAATKRALQIYMGATEEYSGLFGNNPLELARRAELIDRANANSDAAIEDFLSSTATLQRQRATLLQDRAAQQRAVAVAAAQKGVLDAQLADLRATLRAANTASTNARLARAQAPRFVVATRSAVNGGRVSPHHNEPFLVCTRFHESSGNYQVVSSDGFYGAYQFLPSTWDATASRVGRLDLVGLLPNRASEYDQDEMAWALYLWQGNGPWNGRC
ncbi:MAG TPA: transglycosylase family protein [Acidimicrobiia bacterium]|nr:transglycosylase family protein [Acidimicrobiia bacterium]